MIIEDGNYALLYNNCRNRITIFLPQTAETVETTAEPIQERKTEVTSEMLGFLLQMTKYIFDKKDGETWQKV